MWVATLNNILEQNQKLQQHSMTPLFFLLTCYLRGMPFLVKISTQTNKIDNN